MKTCSKCKIRKANEGFYKDKTAKDGYNTICKECRLEMDRLRRKKDPAWVEKRKKQNAEFHNNNREAIANRKKEWGQSPQGRISNLRSAGKYRKKFPEKRYAHDAVYRAVKQGILFRPSHCQLCNSKGKMEAHHASYDCERRTSIVWLCKICHEKLT